MNKNEIQIGRVYKIKSFEGRYLRASHIDEDLVFGQLLNQDGAVIRYEYNRYNNLEPITPSWNLLSIGDEVVDGGFIRKVLTVDNFGKVFGFSWFDDFERLCDFTTISNAQKSGWKLKDSTPKEYTMDEVAKALNVDVKDLKIKKE